MTEKNLKSLKEDLQKIAHTGRHPLSLTFLRWQCRVRQIAMREQQGRPNSGMIPSLMLVGESDAMGEVITVMNKSEPYSKVPEFRFLCQKTHDPAQRRSKALEILCETYYQKAETFDDVLACTFAPNSEGAKALLDAEGFDLHFEAFAQAFRLRCRAVQFDKEEYLYQATFWHNLLFNPTLNPDIQVLGFVPDWEKSRQL